MSYVQSGLLGAIVIGAGATLFVDLWALLLERTLNTPRPNYCLVGRWFLYMPEGTFTHASIAASPPKAAECSVGWIAHYVTGVVFSLMFIAIVSTSWLARPTLLPALLFGTVTVLFPYLLMQPSLGVGIAASKAPNPAQARLKSLVTHVVFGLGLYVFALGVSYSVGLHI